MKIRTNYVSNSSSSSFVIYNFNKDDVFRVMNEFIEQIDFSSEDCSFYNVNPKNINECFEDKLSSSKEEQNDLLTVYIQYKFWNFFDEVFDCFVSQRDYLLSGCEECSEFRKEFEKRQFGECRGCAHLFQKIQAEEHYKNINQFKDEFKEFYFDKEIDKIREIVFNSPTETTNIGEVVVKTDWHEWEKFTKSLSEKYFEMWKKNNPNSFVLSFASDEGNQTEAFIRFEIGKFVEFMVKNGINGFVGENS